MVAVGPGQIQRDLSVLGDVKIVGSSPRSGRTIGTFNTQNHQLEGTGSLKSHRIGRGLADDLIDSTLVGGIAIVQIGAILLGAMEEIDTALRILREDKISFFIDDGFITWRGGRSRIVPTAAIEEIFSVIEIIGFVSL